MFKSTPKEHGKRKKVTVQNGKYRSKSVNLDDGCRWKGSCPAFKREGKRQIIRVHKHSQSYNFVCPVEKPPISYGLNIHLHSLFHLPLSKSHAHDRVL